MFKKAIFKINNIFDNLKYFIGKTVGNTTDYETQSLNWLSEISTKNRIIHEGKALGKDKETIGRKRSFVYWIDFGVNVGSEFNFPHFCVVIKEFKYTAIVIPLSSVKTDDSEWKTKENLIFEIGKIQNFPNAINSYAMLNHITSVSKQRLSYYKDSNHQYLKNLKLNTIQMDKIDSMILQLCQIDTNLAFLPNDYY